MAYGAWAEPEAKRRAKWAEEIIPLTEVADHFGLARRTIYDRAWRARVGLPVVKLGGRILGVRASDLRRALRREQLRPRNGTPA